MNVMELSKVYVLTESGSEWEISQLADGKVEVRRMTLFSWRMTHFVTTDRFPAIAVGKQMTGRDLDGNKWSSSLVTEVKWVLA